MIFLDLDRLWMEEGNIYLHNYYAFIFFWAIIIECKS